MRLTRILSCGAVVTLVVATVEAGMITNVPGRRTTSLNGQWRAIVDPYETGYYTYRYEPRPDGFFLDQKPATKSDLIEYDFDGARTLLVPGDWNTQDAALFLYEGTVWYRRQFSHARQPGRRVFVHFGAVNYHAIVYLNGVKLGEHEGGFTPFQLEITAQLRDGGNTLVVKVDNTRHRDGVPTLNTDWWNYGGITRDVCLLDLPETFIEDYFLQLAPGSTDELAGWVRLSDARSGQLVTLAIPEVGLKLEARTDERGLAQVRGRARFALWSPENPKLYDVSVQSGADTVRDALGFRSIVARGGDILLNGKPLFLRGICIHEEAPIRSGRALSVEEARTLLGWVKELGGNFARLAHYPHNEAMAREADRLGVLLWSEIPVYWTIQFDNPAVLEKARSQLRENVTRDRNRAAVIIWSVANETPVGDGRTRFLTTLVADVRALDATRLVSAALERHYLSDGVTQMIDDPLGAVLDVIGCNEYVGWYDGLPEKCDRVQWRTTYEKPLIMSEFGGDALAGHHGDALTRWTEEYQASLYEHQIAMLRRIPFLRGVTPWILADFRSPRRQLPAIQDFFNRKGLVSDRGERKQAFYILQRYYRELMDTARSGRR
jgi:beta-glucuronidase